jgi:hypothetical protein
MELITVNFSQALSELKNDKRLSRIGWNNENKWIQLINACSYEIFDIPENYSLEPFIIEKTAEQRFVPWVASQSDLLANDWMVVEKDDI